MRIQHNIPAMGSYRNYTNNVNAVSKNLEKLSSGYKVNRAGDDAAGLAISEKMRIQITGLEQAQNNAKSGINLVQTAEGALTEVHDMLKRMYTLAEQSANGTYQDDVDREQLQKEVNSLRTEINRIADATNYNGINLLDGSLSSSGTSASLAEADLSKLPGVLAGATMTIDPVKGKYDTSATFTAPAAARAEGDTWNASFTLKDANGKEQTISIELTLAKDSNGALKKFVAADGSEYDVAAATAGQPTVAEIGDAILAELQKNSVIRDNFSVEENAGKFTFTAKTGGTQAMQVTGVELSDKVKSSGTVTTVDTAMKVTTPAVDAFESIDLSKAKTFDGSTNLDKAVFEINGEKFVFIDKGAVNSDSLAMLKEAGVEHYVEATNVGSVVAGDVTKMAEKISMETGLEVEQGTATAGTGGAANTWAKSTSGTSVGLKSRSSAGSSKGGLTLQIGDTAEKFNKMTVSIKDMHAKAMGIGSIDISTQEGASAAMDAIKNATNYVSDVRGDLGALQNRLDHTINNLSVAEQNIQDAESTIRDVDVAKEMMAYTKNNILVQSAQAMLAQANQLPQGVLQLLG